MPRAYENIQVVRKVRKLNNEQEICGFSEKMLHPPKKGQRSSVERLEIAVGEIGFNTAERLAVVFLTYAKSMPIEELKLADTESLLGSAPKLADAFARLTYVKNLSLRGVVGEHGARMVTMLQSKLVKAQLFLEGAVPWRKTEDERAISNPIALLRNSQDTLESLWVSAPHMADFMPEVYPKMSELTMREFDVLRTYDLVHAYPNLTKLEIEYPRFTGTPDSMTQARQQNQEEQRERNSWRFLHSVKSPVSTLYMLSLQCPVDRLEVTITSKEDAQKLGRVLEETNPAVLELETTCKRILDRRSVLTAMRQEGAQRMRCTELKLVVKVQLDDTETHVHMALKRIRRELRGVQITSLELTIDCVDFMWTDDNPVPFKTQSDLASSIPRGLCLRTEALELAFATSSLVHVDVAVVNSPSHINVHAGLFFQPDSYTFRPSERRARHPELEWLTKTADADGDTSASDDDMAATSDYETEDEL
ncbi:hypothetical protein C8Q74DRAFT_765291 [Fomes fomentarius]|nr:hypothetical protein C8Q74DRAFT_765291 [Fomes fomentarius]